MSAPSPFSLGEVHVASSPTVRFEEFLTSRGKRITQQRKFLVEKVFSRHEHFEADDLVEELARGQESCKISRPTIYRTLSEMVGAGLLRQVSLPGRTVYEHDYGYPQHDHLYCTRCRKLLEFQSDALMKLRDEVAAEQGFRVSGHRMIIQGICRDCSKRRRKKRKQDLV